MKTKIYRGLLWALAQLGYMALIVAVMAVGWGVCYIGYLLHIL